MTLFGQTLVLYLVIGTGVAGAVYLTWGGDRGTSRWFVVATAVLFWPLYLPMLLAKGASVREPSVITTAPNDELTAAIVQVDSELEAALGCLDGWAEDVLAREKDRIRELRSAWLAQAQRICEMDQLLARPEYVAVTDEPAAGEGDPRLRNSLQARRQNVERLQRLRGRAHDDLTRSLAWVREVVSMIHLAKFSGAPAARAEELVAQIAAAVEGLSELTWQEDLPSGQRPTGIVHPEPVAR
jgi:hypothetical protein